MDIQSLIPPLSDDEFEALKEDIAKHGVIVPVVIDQHGAIVDGHHRVRACKELGIEDYPVIVRAYPDEDNRTEDMLKLNLQRRHIDKQQLNELIQTLYHDLHWSQRRIARVLGISRQTVFNALDLQKWHQVAQFDHLMQQSQDDAEDYSIGADGKRYPRSAFAKNRREARLVQDLLSSIGAVSEYEEQPHVMTIHELKKQARQAHVAETHNPPDVTLPANVELYCEDFRTGMERIPDDSVQLIFTDPPYGKEYIPLYEDLARLAARKLEDGGSLLCYVGQTKLPDVLPMLSKHLRYFWICCCLHQHGNQLMNAHGVSVMWKPILWFVKGWRAEPTIVVQDVVRGAPDKTFHPWQQSVEEARYYIRWLTTPDGTVVDPFAGTGTTLVAAWQEGRHSIGFEIDPDTYASALVRLSKECDRNER